MKAIFLASSLFSLNFALGVMGTTIILDLRIRHIFILRMIGSGYF